MLVARRDPFHSDAHDAAYAQGAGVRSAAPKLARTVNMLQVVGSLLAIPVGLASGYSIYRANFSVDTTCQALRANIVSMIDKSVDASTRRMLVRRDVEKFEQSCGAIDPDATAAFKELLAADKAPVPAAAMAAPAPQRAEAQPKPAVRKIETRPQVAAKAPAEAWPTPAALTRPPRSSGVRRAVGRCGSPGFSNASRGAAKGRRRDGAGCARGGARAAACKARGGLADTCSDTCCLRLPRPFRPRLRRRLRRRYRLRRRSLRRAWRRPIPTIRCRRPRSLNPLRPLTRPSRTSKVIRASEGGLRKSRLWET